MSVTRAEFIEHIVVSGSVMLVALAIAAYVRFRFDVGHRAFIRLAIGWFVAVGAVALLSLTAKITERRCPRDPVEWCRFNDNIPLIATVVFIYVGACLVRSFFLHFNR